MSQPYPTRPAFATLQSPSASAISTSSSTTSLASPSPLSMPAQQQPQQQQHSFLAAMDQQEPRRQAQRHPSFEYRPNRDGAGQTASETTAYLNQAALLAEAAKRAQMAVVMRDIEGMEL
jgi:hypothetical protein